MDIYLPFILWSVMRLARGSIKRCQTCESDYELDENPECPTCCALLARTLETTLEIDSQTYTLIVHDKKRVEIANMFFYSVKLLKAPIESFVVTPRLYKKNIIPKELIEKMRESSVIINLLEDKIEYNAYRVQLLQIEKGTGARIGHAVGVTKRMMKPGGSLFANPTEMSRIAERLLKLLRNAKELHITTQLGTDLNINVLGREFRHDLICPEGVWINLPNGEILIAPIELQAHGKIVVDITFAGLTLEKNPVTLKISDGKIIKIRCKNTSIKEKIKDAISSDNWSDVIGLFAFGINPNANVTNETIEAIKTVGTAYVAFGNNLEAGGLNPSITQRVFLFDKPTIKVKYRDDSEKVIIFEGDFCVGHSEEEEKMIESTTNVLDNVLDMKAEEIEEVLIIYDNEKKAIHDAFKYGAMQNNARISSYELNNNRPITPFYLFSLKKKYIKVLNKDKLDTQIRNVFNVNNNPLSKEAKLVKMGKISWKIIDKSSIYKIVDSGTKLEIFDFIPEDLKRKIRARDIIINVFSARPDETPFRVSLLDYECIHGARVGHCPGITLDMLTEGAMTADYKVIRKKANILAEAFKEVTNVHITSVEGTNLRINISNRGYVTDAKILPGNWGNLPAGEIWWAPHENDATGTLIVDGSIGDIGPVDKPLIIKIKQGKVSSIEGDDKKLIRKIEKLLAVDDMANVIGEFGIGLNPKANLTGNLLEDEKAGNTAHIAFGNNDHMPGGKNKSSTHRDFLFYNPTVIVKKKDGSETTIMKDGEHIFELRSGIDKGSIEYAKIIINEVMGLKKGQKMLVLCDQKMRRVSEIFIVASRKMGVNPTLYIIPESIRPLTHIPSEITAILRGHSGIINLFEMNLPERYFRTSLLRQEIKGRKVIHAINMAEDLMDSVQSKSKFKKIKKRIERFMSKVKSAKKIEITTKAGTNLIFDISGKKFISNIKVNKNQIITLPLGRVSCVPKCQIGKGNIVVDCSVSGFGMIREPILLTLKEGRIIKVECDDEIQKLMVNEYIVLEKGADLISDFGFGFNPQDKLRTHINSQDKFYGTAYISFGGNQLLFRGSNISGTYRTYVMYEPTVKAFYTKGKPRTIMKNGELMR